MITGAPPVCTYSQPTFVYESPVALGSSIIAADGDHRPLALADRGSIIFAVTSLKR